MFDVFIKLTWFFKQHKKRYLFSVLGIMTASALGLLPPKLIGYVVDNIRFQSISQSMLITVIIIFLSVILTHYIVTYLWNTALFSGSVTLEKVMRSRLMRHFLKMSPTFYTRFKTGDLMARSTNDLKAISLTAGFGILTLVDATTFMFMIIAMMGFTISWKLTFAALIPLPIMALIMNKYGAVIHKRFTVAQNAFGDMNNGVLESIRGVRVIRAFVQEDEDAKRFRHMTDDVFEKNMAVAKVDALFEPTMKILVGIAYTIGLGYGSILVFESAMTLGDLVTFNVYLGMLIWPMFAVGELINIMQRGNASLDRVEGVLSYQADIKNQSNPRSIQKVDRIDIKNVVFSYPNQNQIQLELDSLEVIKGDTIGVVGKTGSGKTSLFKLLLRQFDKQSGDILWNGIPIEQLDIYDIRRLIGYVPQEQILFSKTIRENIKHGNETASDEEIYRVMELAHFLNDIKQLPEGLNTLVGESGVTLSGGQKQRVALARAFIKNPDILILDDSLSAVDGTTEAAIIDHLKEERQDKTTFIAAHRLSAVRHADEIIVLENGKISERGSHDELMKQNGWYQSQFEQQKMEE